MKRFVTYFACLVLIIGSAAASADTVDVSTSEETGVASESAQVSVLIQDWGVSVEEATARIDRQDVIGDFADLMATKYPGEFGGMWIDHADGGLVKVLVRTPGIAVSEAAGFGLVDVVREVPAERSWSELWTISREIWQTLRERDVILDTEIGVEENRILVTIPEDSTSDQKETAAEFEGRYGAGVRLVVGTLREYFDDACSDTACDPPIRGGIQVSGSAPSPCSTGFVMKNSGGAKRILDSAHCNPNANGNFKHNGTVIGGTINVQDNGDVDARTIGFDSVTYWDPKRWVFHQAFGGVPGDASFTITSRATNASIVSGTYLCRTGYNSNTRCGIVDVVGGGNIGNNDGLYGILACALGGDSGGAVYDDSAHRAYGIHVGSDYGGSCPDPDIDEISFFSPIQSIENALNVTVFTG